MFRDYILNVDEVRPVSCNLKKLHVEAWNRIRQNFSQILAENPEILGYTLMHVNRLKEQEDNPEEPDANVEEEKEPKNDDSEDEDEEKREEESENYDYYDWFYDDDENTWNNHAHIIYCLINQAAEASEPKSTSDGGSRMSLPYAHFIEPITNLLLQHADKIEAYGPRFKARLATFLMLTAPENTIC